MNTWIVVADSSRARIFTLTEDGKSLQLVDQHEHPASQLHERDLITDRPGRTFDSNGPGRHAMSENVSPKEHETVAFCKELTEALERARTAGSVDRLVIVAAPAILGRIRKRLSPSTARLVATEIDKNLSYMDAPDILSHLPDDSLE